MTEKKQNISEPNIEPPAALHDNGKNTQAFQDVIILGWEINSLTRFYQLDNSETITKFLKNHRFLIPLLRELPEKIDEFFGLNQKLLLTVTSEPDVLQSAELWIYVLTELPAKKAFEILEEFDEKWWLENLDRADAKLNISLKYI